MSDTNKQIVAVISETYSEYHKPILTHLSKFLADAGFGTLCVSGFGKAMRGEPVSGVQLLDARNHQELDDFDIAGHIVLTGSVTHVMSEEDRATFFNAISHLPTISMGVELPGVTSVVHQQEATMRALMEHMTEDPTRKRFAFLRGFARNDDSQLRESIFRQGLAEKSIAVDESLIIDGDFAVGRAYSAMCNLLKSGKRFDAVVAANDLMAGSAIRALNEFGLKVPEDVIVSGFDGSPEAVTIHPPLTTVRQDNRIISQRVVEEFNRMVEAHKTGTDCSDSARCIGVDCDLIIRSSTMGGSLQCVNHTDRAFENCAPDERIAEIHQRLIVAYSQVSIETNAFELLLIDATIETLSEGSDALPRVIAEALKDYPVSGDTMECCLLYTSPSPRDRG